MNCKTLLAAAIAANLLVACGSSSDDDEEIVPPTTDVINLENVAKVLETNADIALASYSDSVDTAQLLLGSINTFAAAPTQANLDAAKMAWLVSREPYGQTEVYRFRLSPIDSTDYASEDGLEGEINAWPLGEGLIDYVSEGGDFGDDEIVAATSPDSINYPSVNIINSGVEITEALITGAASENDVIAGYHAIEFMLWGQDLDNNAQVTTGDNREMAVKTSAASNVAAGGQRPLTDFTSDQYASRRLEYLQVVATKLISDLESVQAGWEEGASYRTAFVTVADKSEAIQKLTEILTGMGTLSEGELAGERMQISFSANSQEDEHSCFSDNTHRDIWLNAEGVSNSYYGDYAGYDSTLDGTDDATGRAVAGYGLDDYIVDLDIADLTALAAELDANLTTTATNYMAIDTSARNGEPVDVLIMDANRDTNNPMYKTIISLNTQSSSIANLALALEVTASVVDDDASGCDTSTPDVTCD